MTPVFTVHVGKTKGVVVQCFLPIHGPWTRVLGTHYPCVHRSCSRVVHVHRPLYETRRAAADWCLHTENVRRCCTAKMPVMTVVVIFSVMAMTLIGFMLVAVFLALRLDSLSRVSRSHVVSVVLCCPLSQIPLRCPASEPAGSRAGLPPASELDSVMEFGFYTCYWVLVLERE